MRELTREEEESVVFILEKAKQDIGDVLGLPPFRIGCEFGEEYFFYGLNLFDETYETRKSYGLPFLGCFELGGKKKK